MSPFVSLFPVGARYRVTSLTMMKSSSTKTSALTSPAAITCWGLSFWLSMIGFNLAFFPMHFLGLAGMPRRIPDYALQFAEWNMWSSIGAWIFGASQLLLVYNVIHTVRSGRAAAQKPWEGADSLEWTHLPTPAPYHSFETAPVVK